ncbi:type VII secretion protein EssB [Pseudolactococcus reticulitermitis]|uniref:Type VII secretion protein EssB n=1 Tax=Pseudolactococcus reticulitermitis TaxID=2025039 RepID=A0A224X6Z7_9LACT|nr:type VII secretion protein EssB [Lactococcus reticulitermitis]GAX48316.1 hypothetical protein RsY01_1932 [Lactococcus reticulitermitis]
MKLFNGKEYLEFIKENNQIQVILNKKQYDKDATAVIQAYFKAENVEDTLIVTYDLPEDAISFTQNAKNAKTRIEKLQLADKVSQLVTLANHYQIPFIHPENLYFSGEHLFVVHFGLDGILSPSHYDNTFFLRNLKALILPLFSSKLNYEKFLEGSSALTDKFLQMITQAEDCETLFSIIRQELMTTESEIKATKRLVSKNIYRFYRTVGIIGLLVAIGVGVLGYQTSNTNKKQAAIIEAQTSFMTNNYAKTQSDLEKYAPKDLTKSAKYILAVSSINLADLTATQKQAVLNNISIKSDDNTLNYWLYVGRGEFEKALNLAQNLGDEQLTLLAYTDLYQTTKLNDKMDGAKKQKLLADYSKQIEELTKKLGK